VIKEDLNSNIEYLSLGEYLLCGVGVVLD